MGFGRPRRRVLAKRNRLRSIVEQDVGVALRHADRGYVLETGRVVLADTAEALLANPRVRDAYLGLATADETLR